jgi:hypothetical protein
MKTLREGRSLGPLLANRLETDAGSVFADVPSDVPEELIYRFGSAMVAGPVDSPWRFAEFLSTELSAQKAFLVAEDDLAQKGDPWLETSEDKPVTLGSNLLWLLPNDADLSQSTVETFFSYCYSTRMIAAVVPGIPPALPGDELNPNALAESAEAASLVVVSAWDDTGFVCWEPTA